MTEITSQNNNEFIEIDGITLYNTTKIRIMDLKGQICSFKNPKITLNDKLNLFPSFFKLMTNYNYIKTIIYNHYKDYKHIKQDLFEILDKLLNIFDSENEQRKIVEKIVVGTESMLIVFIFCLNEINANDDKINEFKSKATKLIYDLCSYCIDKGLSNEFNWAVGGLKPRDFVEKICNDKYKVIIINNNEKQKAEDDTHNEEYCEKTKKSSDTQNSGTTTNVEEDNQIFFSIKNATNSFEKQRRYPVDSTEVGNCCIIC